MTELTIDTLIEKLQAARETANMGGNTVVCLCVEETEPLPVTDAVLENDDVGSILYLKSNDLDYMIDKLLSHPERSAL